VDGTKRAAFYIAALLCGGIFGFGFGLFAQLMGQPPSPLLPPYFPFPLHTHWPPMTVVSLSYCFPISKPKALARLCPHFGHTDQN